jgi:hypothetical protein
MDKKIVRAEDESELASYWRERSTAYFEEISREEPAKSVRTITTNYDQLLEVFISHPDKDHLDAAFHEEVWIRDLKVTRRRDGGVDVELKTKAVIFVDTVGQRIVESFRDFLTYLTTATKKRLTKKAPGTNLLRFVDFFFAASTMEKTFKPLVADWRTEYFDALQQGRKIKARWISVRYMWAFMLAMGLSRIMALFKKFSSA